MKRMLWAITLLVGLANCGEWKPYTFHKDTTGEDAACFAPRGSLSSSPEWVQRLHQCVAACEAHGFRLTEPESVPPPVPIVEGAKPPSIPNVCQASEGVPR
jgi:hypothetical protein